MTAVVGGHATSRVATSPATANTREQGGDMSVDKVGELEKRKVSTSREYVEEGTRDRLRDVNGDIDRDEVVLAVDDQRRDGRLAQPRQEVVTRRRPGFGIQPLLDCPCRENAVLRGSVRSQTFDDLLDLRWRP